jgi:Predicted membrane protein (DUF2306)
MKVLSTKWFVALLLLCIVPVLAGMVRMAQLASGVVTPENARFFASPLPVIIHVASVTLFCVVGAFQFVPSLRVKNKWHRTSGRLLVPFGFASAVTGLWMAHFYALPASDGSILYVERLIVSAAMLIALFLGVMAIRRRDYPPPSQLDDARLRHRHGCRNTSADQCDLDFVGRRAQCKHAGGADGGGLGDQCGGGRVVDMAKGRADCFSYHVNLMPHTSLQTVHSRFKRALNS